MPPLSPRKNRRKEDQRDEQRSLWLRVPFWELTEEGYKKIGAIELQKGRAVARPAEERVLQRVLAEPIYVMLRGTQTMKWIQAGEEPELFVRYLPYAYHGSYFRAGDVKEIKRPTKKRKV